MFFEKKDNKNEILENSEKIIKRYTLKALSEWRINDILKWTYLLVWIWFLVFIFTLLYYMLFVFEEAYFSLFLLLLVSFLWFSFFIWMSQEWIQSYSSQIDFTFIQYLKSQVEDDKIKDQKVKEEINLFLRRVLFFFEKYDELMYKKESLDTCFEVPTNLKLSKDEFYSLLYNSRNSLIQTIFDQQDSLKEKLSNIQEIKIKDVKKTTTKELLFQIHTVEEKIKSIESNSLLQDEKIKLEEELNGLYSQLKEIDSIRYESLKNVKKEFSWLFKNLEKIESIRQDAIIQEKLVKVRV